MRILFLMQEPHQEPLGAGYLISAAKAAGHDATGRFFRSPAQAARIAARHRPDIVAYSVMTGSHRFYLDVNKLVKKSAAAFSIFGGPHPTYSPEFINEDGVDATCRGEGETAFVALLDSMDAGGRFDDTANFSFKTNGAVKENPLGSLVPDLDSLPFPDRGFFYSSAAMNVSRLRSFIAGRGCPYSCTYCFNHIHNEMYRGLGAIVRRRSVDNVISEAVSVMDEYPTEMAQFMDDTFILSAEWLEEFSEKFPAEAGIPFFCNVRAELVTRDIVRDLKRAGCASVCVGVETGDEELRKTMLGRSHSNGRLREAISMFRLNRIRVMTTNMLGIPGGTLESDLKTFRLNAECGVDYAWTSLTYPYPGTAIHARAAALGLGVPPADDLPFSYFNSMPFDTPDKHRIENLHRLLAAAASLRLREKTLMPLIGARGKFAAALYSLVFGLWKLYCYESRIFRRRPVFWFATPDFVPKLFSNISIGAGMMSGGRRRSS